MSKETTLNVVFCLRQIPQGKHSNINFELVSAKYQAL